MRIDSHTFARKQTQSHVQAHRCLPIATMGFVRMNHAFGQRFRAHGPGATRTGGAVCFTASAPDNRVFLFMVPPCLEHIERRKRLNSALFSKDCRAHERSRHNQANRERDSKGPECEEVAKVDRLLQHKREERRGKTHKDAGHIGADRDKPKPSRQKISICNSYSAKSIPRVTDLDKPSRRGLNISICNT